jgi:hypothetical protein
MALYLGSDRVKININGTTYYLDLFSDPIITNGIRLLSSEGYILKDLNNIYITSKDGDE